MSVTIVSRNTEFQLFDRCNTMGEEIRIKIQIYFFPKNVEFIKTARVKIIIHNYNFCHIYF